MSEMQQPPGSPPPGPPFGTPTGMPPRYYPPPPPPPRGNPLLGCGFALSLLLNVIAAILVIAMCMGIGFVSQTASFNEITTNAKMPETYYSGKSSAKQKVAIVSLDGVIMEGMLNFVHRQIDQAARDKDVKAVVLRINSPGGSITASDELYRRLTKLVQGDTEKKADPKPLIVSMGSMAASGGYYVAMPAQTIFAERTTLTGSIGVFASFPNIAGLAKKWEFGMTTIKQGEIKDSGSPFKEMTPKERLVWQDMVDHAYDQFLDVVIAGRAKKLTKADLLAPITVDPINAGPKWLENEQAKPYQRYRADGGIWTSDKALELKLVDQVGSLDDAIKGAHDAANLGEDYKAVRYEKRNFLELLFGEESSQPDSLIDPDRLRGALTLRLWYLAPGCEMAGVLAGKASR